MTILKQIKKEQQLIARCEQSIALEKLKKRRADTRRKIELGGLVIKSGMEGFNKAIILGALEYIMQLLEKEPDFKNRFEARGEVLFLN